VNTPIQQGFSVATAKESFAEIQFENGSTVRLGELSRVDFSELALTPDGDKVNHVSFDEGYGTFHFIPEHHDEYVVQVAGVKVTPHGKAEFRIDLFQPQMRVEVSEGEVQVVDSHQSEKLGKEKVLTCDFGAGTPFQIARGIEKDSWDKWVAARDEQSTLAYNDSAVSIDAPTYGWDDLDAYGD
jgi:ferric-dicitrate binding protein FerR (iron transport regulator)